MLTYIYLNVTNNYYAMTSFRLCDLPLGGKIDSTITWRMAFLTWTKPGDNLKCYG